MTHNSGEGAGNDMKTNHRPSGTMCATCANAQKDCSALEFSTMRAIKKDADGTIVVRCGEYKRGIDNG